MIISKWFDQKLIQNFKVYSLTNKTNRLESNKTERRSSRNKIHRMPISLVFASRMMDLVCIGILEPAICIALLAKLSVTPPIS